MENELQQQNELLKALLTIAVEAMPAHATDCGVYNAHPSYGNKYCNCKIVELRTQTRKLLRAEIGLNGTLQSKSCASR